jgi:two-component system, OmpR family, response regulator
MDELKRVMFVEDDADLFPLIEMSLSLVGGFDVRGFMHGEDAVREAAAFDPQLVMLDFMMPGMDGPTTMSALRQLDGFAAKPYAFLTAKIQEEHVNRLYALGAAEVMSKPFDPVTLPEALKRIWQAWQAAAPRSGGAIAVQPGAPAAFGGA